MLLHVTSVSHREYVRSLYSHPPEIKVYHGRPPYPPARGSALCTPELTARKQSTILDKSHAKITQEYNKLEGKKDAAARCARKNRRRSGHCRRAKAEPPRISKHGIAGQPRSAGSLSRRDGPSSHLGRRSCVAAFIGPRKDWTDPKPILSYPGRNFATEEGLIQLSDGSLLLRTIEQWARRREDPPPASPTISDFQRRVRRVLSLVSHDRGNSWSEPQEDEMHPRFVEYQRGGWGRHHELADGRVMVPVFGPMKEEPEAWALAVGFSADGGRTFIDLAVMATAPAEKRKFCENSILRLDDGRFLAVIREETPSARTAFCENGSWLSSGKKHLLSGHTSATQKTTARPGPPQCRSTSRANARVSYIFAPALSSVPTGTWSRTAQASV